MKRRSWRFLRWRSWLWPRFPSAIPRPVTWRRCAWGIFAAGSLCLAGWQAYGEFLYHRALARKDAGLAIELVRLFPQERRFSEAASLLIAADPKQAPSRRLAVVEQARVNDPYSPRLAFFALVAAAELGDRGTAEQALGVMERTAPGWPETRMAREIIANRLP